MVVLRRKRMASWVSSATSTKTHTNTDTEAPTQKVQRQDMLHSKCWCGAQHLLSKAIKKEKQLCEPLKTSLMPDLAFKIHFSSILNREEQLLQPSGFYYLEVLQSTLNISKKVQVGKILPITLFPCPLSVRWCCVTMPEEPVPAVFQLQILTTHNKYLQDARKLPASFSSNTGCFLSRLSYTAIVDKVYSSIVHNTKSKTHKI